MCGWRETIEYIIELSVRFIVFALVVIFICGLCGILREQEDKTMEQTSMFVQLDDGQYWTVYFHKNTKIMYIRTKGSFGTSDIEIMVDADGKPMKWE